MNGMADNWGPYGGLKPQEEIDEIESKTKARNVLIKIELIKVIVGLLLIFGGIITFIILDVKGYDNSFIKYIIIGGIVIFSSTSVKTFKDFIP